MKTVGTRAQGFTLLELITVVVIIAILALGAFVSSLYVATFTKVAKVKDEQRTLVRALSNYELDYSTLPDTRSGLHVLNAPTAYLVSLPKDPFAPDRETYLYVANPANDFRYMIISPGPDGRYDLDPNSLDSSIAAVSVNPQEVADFESYCRTRTYDPTNGIKSEGDIFILSK
jgi:prepilin-type N-terminal cleavage/methylation domain-containing protein